VQEQEMSHEVVVKHFAGDGRDFYQFYGFLAMVRRESRALSRFWVGVCAQHRRLFDADGVALAVSQGLGWEGPAGTAVNTSL
jgi:hypothetical protein